MLKVLLERRSIRKYKDDLVESEKVKQILGAGQLAPSGKNKKPWEFIVIENREVLKKLSEVKPKGGTFLEDAPIAIAIVGLEANSDTWMEDCSIASTFIQLEAENQGLGSCWVQLKSRFTKDGEDAEKLGKKILEIEDEKRLLCVISIGYSNQKKIVYKEEDYVEVEFKTIK
ncbi:MAG: nitroreductase family protein [Psychrilyobacter sp.]|nr:nitroreductase family protein [Psychrilyobacter sp.]